MEFLANYGLFLAKTVTFLVAVFAVIMMIVIASSKSKKSEKGQIQVSKLNEKFDAMRDLLREATQTEDELKAFEKAEKKRLKEEKAASKIAAKEKAAKEKAAKEADSTPDVIVTKKRAFVVSFNGDVKASGCDNLREEISAILTLAKPEDEVVVKLESPGGMVHGYGLASSQLTRITNKNIPLTICVDKVAASGGYMMACVADKIIAAPFAVLGSIGVVAQLPNFHRLLKKHDVDYEMFTAGEFKRTVTMFGENTEKGRQKFVEDLEDTHQLFKEFVSEHRPQVDISAVATGEVWYGQRAKNINLIDEIKTSDEYLLDLAEQADIFEIEYSIKKSLPEKMGMAAQVAVEKTLLGLWERSQLHRWF